MFVITIRLCGYVNGLLLMANVSSMGASKNILNTNAVSCITQLTNKHLRLSTQNHSSKVYVHTLSVEFIYLNLLHVCTYKTVQSQGNKCTVFGAGLNQK